MAVQYDNVIDRNGVNIGSVLVRYCHLASFLKTSGTVERYEQIAIMGNSGTEQVHLHMELGSPSSSPCNSPSEGSADNTMDPFRVLHIGINQIVNTDEVVGGNPTDYLGRSWYNTAKITYFVFSDSKETNSADTSADTLPTKR